MNRTHLSPMLVLGVALGIGACQPRAFNRSGQVANVDGAKVTLQLKNMQSTACVSYVAVSQPGNVGACHGGNPLRICPDSADYSADILASATDIYLCRQDSTGIQTLKAHTGLSLQAGSTVVMSDGELEMPAGTAKLEIRNMASTACVTYVAVSQPGNEGMCQGGNPMRICVESGSKTVDISTRAKAIYVCRQDSTGIQTLNAHTNLSVRAGSTLVLDNGSLSQGGAESNISLEIRNGQTTNCNSYYLVSQPGNEGACNGGNAKRICPDSSSFSTTISAQASRIFLCRQDAMGPQTLGTFEVSPNNGKIVIDGANRVE